MRKLLYYSVKRILDKGLFKFGVESITQKNYEEDLKFTVEELGKGLFKSDLIV